MNQYLVIILNDDGEVILKRGIFTSHHEAVESMALAPSEVMAVLEMPIEIAARVWLSDASEILVEETK